MIMNGISTTPQLGASLYNDYLREQISLQHESQYYDYGFRQQAPQLGRWHAVDKLAESYHSVSPYAYVSNAPINMYDILGLASEGPFNSDVMAMINAAISMGEGTYSGDEPMKEAGVGPYGGTEHSMRLSVGFRGFQTAGCVPNTHGKKLRWKTFTWTSYDYNPPTIYVWVDPSQMSENGQFVTFTNRLETAFEETIYKKFYNLEITYGRDSDGNDTEYKQIFNHKYDINVYLTSQERCDIYGDNGYPQGRTYGRTDINPKIPIWVNSTPSNKGFVAYSVLHEVTHIISVFAGLKLNEHDSEIGL